MTYKYDRTKTASMDLKEITSVLGNVWEALIYVQGQVKGRRDTIHGRLLHLDRDVKSEAKEAEALLRKALDWFDANKDRFNGEGAELDREVFNPLAQAILLCKQTPYSLDNGVSSVKADLKWLQDDVDSVVKRSKDGGDAVRALWDMAEKS